jgi:hypothetical protein
MSVKTRLAASLRSTKASAGTGFDPAALAVKAVRTPNVRPQRASASRG